MKTRKQKLGFVTSKRSLARPLPPDYSALVVIGALLTLVLLSGCSSTPVGGASDAFEYNPNTGYPAVGSLPWH